MSKGYVVGIDVSKDWVDVERSGDDGVVEAGRYDNTPAGHRKVSGWLTKKGRRARVVLEATGPYHAKLATALEARKGIEVMVANPMAVSHFRKALLQRASTDATSASVLREFAQRMEFIPWKPPPQTRLDLRAIARRVESLTGIKTEEKNRLHAAIAGGQSNVVLKDLRENITGLTARVKKLREQALEVIAQEEELQRSFTLLLSIKGVGQVSAIGILSELAVLSQELNVRQWVAWAGLDPKPVESGSSVKVPARISKVGNVHLRRALYMPALVAMRHNPPVVAFAEHLRAKGKKELVIVVAIMRKLLHSIYGILRTGVPFESSKFYRIPGKASATT